MKKAQVLHNIEILVQSPVLMYQVECSENLITDCLSYNQPFGVTAVSAAKVATELFEEGWRNVEHDAMESFLCPPCIKYLCDTSSRDEVKIESWKKGD